MRKVIPVGRRSVGRSFVGKFIPALTSNYYKRYSKLSDVEKHQVILEYAKRFHTRIFIETGTYEGETVAATRDMFTKLFSIELSESLYRQAKEKFSKDTHIQILQGDSGAVLPCVLGEVKEPCLFWLDAHDSKGKTARGNVVSPIMDEMRHILSHPVKTHVILIDDARYFNGTNEYPTLEELHALIRQVKSYRVMEIKRDIIRLVPPVPWFLWKILKGWQWIKNGGRNYWD